MSSFDQRHRIYLFAMKNGKRKLAYGPSPEGALEILRIRLTEAEMAELIPGEFMAIHQRDMRKYIADLG